MFQFTPLVRGATVHSQMLNNPEGFNSRPSCEGRQPNAGFLRYALFQFTPLVRGATLPFSSTSWSRLFQFTPLVRGATRPRTPSRRVRGFNSRPSCEGRHNQLDFPMEYTVSIHAPRARGDCTIGFSTITATFQFTPLVRGATLVRRADLQRRSFNSRPSCEGRLCLV